MLALWVLFLLFMGALGLILFASFSNKKAEQYLPPAGQFAKLRHARLHYVDQGQLMACPSPCPKTTASLASIALAVVTPPEIHKLMPA